MSSTRGEVPQLAVAWPLTRGGWCNFRTPPLHRTCSHPLHADGPGGALQQAERHGGARLPVAQRPRVR